MTYLSLYCFWCGRQVGVYPEDGGGPPVVWCDGDCFNARRHYGAKPEVPTVKP